MTDDARLAALELKVQELDAMVNLALRLLSLEKPVSTLLERYGATEAEDKAVHAILDDVAQRAEQGGIYAPSLNGFSALLFDRFPAVRNNAEFVALLLDTLKLDRPVYRRLHEYAAAKNWLK